MLDVGQDRVSDPIDAVREHPRSFAHAVRGQTQSYVERRKADVARAVSEIADAIRTSGDGFSDSPNVKAFFDGAADGVTEFSAGIARRTSAELYDEVEAAIRRRPAVAAAAAVLAGLALYRVLRASELRPIPRSHAVVPADVFPTPDI
ncbi:hypothetical protein [Methylobacterium oxalidis]|uniref:DUF3618 domain-containing protein n=1 Tax=Methylobacterium oxalidis TaxID=944322 RepID=A0A512J9E3_9HYPH|nr:hypothetical protein [Methylobacterium oxalidis]GEP06525.1 hypothetical protein MOX02_45630 [Methylobacterium oxalidis]GJE30722.1 hypothetical protein LDDCCGHA_0891 [Methylobacterium oxalidis]GLS63897.1 hypothetical protein GCM10007888_22780 [Methylobacterium oxalidis]